MTPECQGEAKTNRSWTEPVGCGRRDGEFLLIPPHKRSLLHPVMTIVRRSSRPKGNLWLVSFSLFL